MSTYMNTKKIWQQVLADLKITLSPAIYKTWFKDLELEDKTETQLILTCPNDYTKEILEKNKYLAIIRDIASKYFKDDLEIVVEVEKKKEIANDGGPLFTNKPAEPEKKERAYKIINRNYTFNSFIIGQSNNLAVAAAQAIVENPGRAYNPFFIYGGVGLGKTHIICAIGNEILKNDSTKKVFYISSEQFTNELILSIQKNKTHLFREKYRQADILIIDDIQFFAGKEASQEEFFHTFNTLYSENKQIILTSDKPPREINKLEERLVSRFEGGLTVDIQSPDYETRVAILNAKCDEKKIKLSHEVIEYIAENISENVRKLEGFLSQVVTLCLFQKKEVEISDVQKLLGKKEERQNKRLSPELILKIVSEFYGIKIKDIKGKSRKAHFVQPRQASMYLLKKELNIPLKQIGDYIGNRDHTTVMHAIDKIEKEVEDRDSEKYKEIITLKKLLLS